MTDKTIGPRLAGVALSVLLSTVVIGGALGGFWFGRHKLGAVIAVETETKSLYDVIGKEIDDPSAARALAQLYGVRPDDRDALVKRLRGVAWVPPSRPAPFVGHVARSLPGDEPHINGLGFRDARDGYATKPDRTIRIFVTGGSMAWGSGAPSQKTTVPQLLEDRLNARLSPVTGLRYEVVNTAFPAWSTTQEKLLVQQKLVDMKPDLILMLSGNNDVHWSQLGADVRWFQSYADQNVMRALDEIYRNTGHAELAVNLQKTSGRPVDCRTVGRITSRNVREAAFAARLAGARLVFALQPNIVSAAKPLTDHERKILARQDTAYWDACYRQIRELSRFEAPGYEFLDLSRSFGDVGGDTELFIDAYHFAELGNRLVAEALFDRIDWTSLKPAEAE